MIPINKFFKFAVLLAVFIFVLPSIVSAWWWNYGPQCDDIVNRENGGYINVLTFNILFSPRSYLWKHD